MGIPPIACALTGPVAATGRNWFIRLLLASELIENSEFERAEAMQTDDVRDFVADLRKQISPEMVTKLLHQTAPEKTYALEERTAASTASAPKARAAKPEPEPKDEAPSAASYWVSLVLLGLGLALAGWLVFATLVWPLME